MTNGLLVAGRPGQLSDAQSQDRVWPEHGRRCLEAAVGWLQVRVSLFCQSGGFDRASETRDDLVADGSW
jgi:hypothetical protein